jgi:hypothetical protein
VDEAVSHDVDELGLGQVARADDEVVVDAALLGELHEQDRVASSRGPRGRAGDEDVRRGSDGAVVPADANRLPARAQVDGVGFLAGRLMGRAVLRADRATETALRTCRSSRTHKMHADEDPRSAKSQITATSKSRLCSTAHQR